MNCTAYGGVEVSTRSVNPKGEKVVPSPDKKNENHMKTLGHSCICWYMWEGLEDIWGYLGEVFEGYLEMFVGGVYIQYTSNPYMFLQFPFFPVRTR